MKNKEKYAEELTMIGKNGKIAISGGKPEECFKMPCEVCERGVSTGRGAYQCSDLKFLEWTDAEYKEPPVDWSKVPVDTKVLVRDDESERWKKRYFAQFENEKVYVYVNGATSWSTQSKIAWKYTKLAEE